MARTVDPEHADYCRELNAESAKNRATDSVADGRVRREDLVTTNELARLWGTSNQTIQRWRQYQVCNFPQPYFDDGSSGECALRFDEKRTGRFH
jgi:hypothetical protein